MTRIVWGDTDSVSPMLGKGIMNQENKGFYFAEECEIQDLGAGVKRQVLSHGGDLMLCHLWFEEGSEGALHHHPHVQTSYVLKGKFEFTVGNETKIVSEGDALYKVSDIIHGCRCLEKGELLDIFTPERKEFLK